MVTTYDISKFCQAAIARSGRDDIVLPLMVAASVGGAERDFGGNGGGRMVKWAVFKTLAGCFM